MAATDGLSGLSDDLLVSILSLLPARDAARTAALSRRWRPLWLRTDALNLATDYRRMVPLLRDARAATGRCPVRRLSLLVTGSSWLPKPSSGTYDLTASLLADPALRHVEELRAGIESNKDVVAVPVPERNKDEHVRLVYKLDPAMLPGQTLRVLDLARCDLRSTRGGATSFPRLTTLRLYQCSSTTKDLEDIVGAAPSLGSLHIEGHNYFSGDKLMLHGPSLTTLTLTQPHDGLPTIRLIELDVPRLRSFRFDGALVKFSMKSPAFELELADLTLGRTYVEDWTTAYQGLLRCLRHAKVLRLKVPNIKGLAGTLVTLVRLEQLELEGPFETWPRDEAAEAMADLLQCCPVIRDLRIRILPNSYGAMRRNNVPLPDFDVSMDLFERRDSEELAPLMLDGDDGGSIVVVPELPGLTDRHFDCFQSHLKNVRMEFELRELNSFEVCLARFFAENCMALEVLEVDDGKHRFFSHIGWMVERWRANASEQRKQKE